ncbi:MAG: tryptophan 2,3-dioxygenase [Mycobacteriales bacterium]
MLEPTRADRAGNGAAGRPTYGEILQLDTLLDLRQRLSGQHDELFFLIAHQVYELWFKVILSELEHARDRMLDRDVPGALYGLRRVVAVERVMVAQVETLETISPGSFAEFRDVFQGTSGFQSAQFREIEFLSGLKDPTYLDRVTVTAAERDRLRRRLAEPTLWDAFQQLVGPDWPAGLPDLLRTQRHTGEIVLAEALLDHDEGFSLWRTRHVHMVERMIGRKPGTGGSSGVSYLTATLEKRFFPELWQARSAV